MATQKEIAQALDTAAGRNSYGATSKQCWFLAGLIARSPSADADYSDWLLNGLALTKAEASRLIEFYLGSEKKAA